MKKTSKQMPKSINSQKNEQPHTSVAQARENTTEHDIRFLKELKGQVLVSIDEFIANRELIQGTLEEGFRLEDGREVTVVIEIKSLAYPLERIADLLLFSLISNIHLHDSRGVNYFLRIQSLSDVAKAFQIIWNIDSILGSDRKIEALGIAHKLNFVTFLQLIDTEGVEQLAEYGASSVRETLNLPPLKVPNKRKIKFVDEYVDPIRISNIFEMGNKAIGIAQEETDSKERGIDLMFTEIMGCIMVAQLRGMRRKETIEYVSNELGSDSKGCVETVLKMLAIDKAA